MINRLQRLLLKMITIFIKTIENWKLPWTKKILNGYEMEELMVLTRPGDVLVVRAAGYFSSFLFTVFKLGTYTHCVFVSGDRKIVDATGVGVSRRPMLSSLIGYTHAAILRPKLTKEESEKAWRMFEEVMEIDDRYGIDYNYTLVEDIASDGRGDSIPDNLTCAQLIRVILNAGRKDYMGLRERFGFLTVSPQDYYDAKSKFDVVAVYE